VRTWRQQRCLGLIHKTSSIPKSAIPVTRHSVRLRPARTRADAPRLRPGRDRRKERPLCLLQGTHRPGGEKRGNVLITGETGTGKELFAQAIHQNATAGTRPLLRSTVRPCRLACGKPALGHEKGALRGPTGPSTDAAPGTRGHLFLDEIGDISPSIQKAFSGPFRDGGSAPWVRIARSKATSVSLPQPTRP
jgi:transcriptional regulator of acetoin/glycerol metabolism